MNCTRTFGIFLAGSSLSPQRFHLARNVGLSVFPILSSRCLAHPGVPNRAGSVSTLVGKRCLYHVITKASWMPLQTLVTETSPVTSSHFLTLVNQMHRQILIDYRKFSLSSHCNRTFCLIFVGWIICQISNFFLSISCWLILCFEPKSGRTHHLQRCKTSINKFTLLRTSATRDGEHIR